MVLSALSEDVVWVFIVLRFLGPSVISVKNHFKNTVFGYTVYFLNL